MNKQHDKKGRFSSENKKLYIKEVRKLLKQGKSASEIVTLFITNHPDVNVFTLSRWIYQEKK